MNITDLRRQLSALPQRELEDLIIEVCNKNKQFRELVEITFDPALENVAFEKYKKQIISEFFTARGFGKLRFSVTRNALKNFMDLSKNPELIADLMMTHVESGVNYTNEYGDIDERFYDNIAGMYVKVLRYIAEHDLKEDFIERCKAVVTSSDGIGWGFHDELYDSFYEYYSE